MRARLLVVPLACALSVVPAAGAAADGGPSPGVSNGWDGIVSPSGTVRYVAVTSGASTVIEKVGTGRGRVLAWASIRGSYGIPLVAYDGTPTGLTRDGKRLVLATVPGNGSFTRLVVVDTESLRVRGRVALPGLWSLDALSPDGTTLFLIQYLPAGNYIHYRVRAYDLAAGRLVAGAIVDKAEPGPVTGTPVHRVESRDGGWAYTLYQRPAGKPFVHALDLVAGSARCLDVEGWRGSQDRLFRARMRLSPDGRSLLLRDGKLAVSVALPG